MNVFKEKARRVTSWKLFEIETPDGRVIRHRHENLRAAQVALQAGYKVTGEVLGASTDDKGGIVDPIGPGTTSIMKTLLEARGDMLEDWFFRERGHVLLAWLKNHGVAIDKRAAFTEEEISAFNKKHK